MWQAQTLAAVRDAHRMGHLTGTLIVPRAEIDNNVSHKVSPKSQTQRVNKNSMP